MVKALVGCVRIYIIFENSRIEIYQIKQESPLAEHGLFQKQDHFRYNKSVFFRNGEGNYFCVDFYLRPQDGKILGVLFFVNQTEDLSRSDLMGPAAVYMDEFRKAFSGSTEVADWYVVQATTKTRNRTQICSKRMESILENLHNHKRPVGFDEPMVLSEYPSWKNMDRSAVGTLLDRISNAELRG